ncbi:MAG: Linoleoyl-CoA desaturase, partial [uncultured Quadrisphaera sp.]
DPRDERAQRSPHHPAPPGEGPAPRAVPRRLRVRRAVGDHPGDGAAGAALRLHLDAAERRRPRAGRRRGRVLADRRLVVPAHRRRRPRGRRHPDRLPRPRGRAPAAVHLGAVERVDHAGAGRPAQRHELDVVVAQAHQAPRRPQPGGQGPRHRVVGAGLHPRRREAAGPGRLVVRRPPGLVLLPPAAPRGPEPARAEHQGPVRARRRQAPLGRAQLHHRAPRRLPRRDLPGAAPRQGRRLPRRPAGPLRPLHGLLLRAQPQGHAPGARVDEGRLPAPPGAHVPQHPRRALHHLAARRAEPPGRAPPVPEHAPPQPGPRPGGRAPVLRRARRGLHRDRPAHLVRHRRPVPEPGGPGRPRPVRVPAGRELPPPGL